MADFPEHKRPGSGLDIIGGFALLGWGSIWEYGRPDFPTGDVIALDRTGLSPFAVMFLDMLGPLDRRGWHVLFDGPMEGWPAGEIIAAAYGTPTLKALIPIDRVGMLTDLNPMGVYLREQGALKP
jgi:hypothetical protein